MAQTTRSPAVSFAGVAGITRLTDQVYAEIGTEVSDFGTSADRIRLWAELTTAAKNLTAVAKEFGEAVAEDLGDTTLDVEGIGPVRSKRSMSRKEWQHEALVDTVAARLSDEINLLVDDEGEMLPPSIMMRNVLHRFLQVATPTWKMGSVAQGTPGLKPLGIRVENFCREELGGWKLEK